MATATKKRAVARNEQVVDDGFGSLTPSQFGIPETDEQTETTTIYDQLQAEQNESTTTTDGESEMTTETNSTETVTTDATSTENAQITDDGSRLALIDAYKAVIKADGAWDRKADEDESPSKKGAKTKRDNRRAELKALLEDSGLSTADLDQESLAAGEGEDVSEMAIAAVDELLKPSKDEKEAESAHADGSTDATPTDVDTTGKTGVESNGSAAATEASSGDSDDATNESVDEPEEELSMDDQLEALWSELMSLRGKKRSEIFKKFGNDEDKEFKEVKLQQNDLRQVKVAKKMVVEPFGLDGKDFIIDKIEEQWNETRCRKYSQFFQLIKLFENAADISFARHFFVPGAKEDYENRRAESDRQRQQERDARRAEAAAEKDATRSERVAATMEQTTEALADVDARLQAMLNERAKKKKASKKDSSKTQPEAKKPQTSPKPEAAATKVNEPELLPAVASAANGNGQTGSLLDAALQELATSREGGKQRAVTIIIGGNHTHF